MKLFSQFLFLLLLLKAKHLSCEVVKQVIVDLSGPVSTCLFNVTFTNNYFLDVIRTNIFS